MQAEIERQKKAGMLGFMPEDPRGKEAIFELNQERIDDEKSAELKLIQSFSYEKKLEFNIMNAERVSKGQDPMMAQEFLDGPEMTKLKYDNLERKALGLPPLDADDNELPFEKPIDMELIEHRLGHKYVREKDLWESSSSEEQQREEESSEEEES